MSLGSSERLISGPSLGFGLPASINKREAGRYGLELLLLIIHSLSYILYLAQLWATMVSLPILQFLDLNYLRVYPFWSYYIVTAYLLFQRSIEGVVYHSYIHRTRSDPNQRHLRQFYTKPDLHIHFPSQSQI
ncbi:hypothetical protein I308_104916 [Cryptococcus tetragattii IND107]|uniref:Uncharacterized protein n=1 Tax=Cryptococcus tetragattii IND107 TaxID=1296105 RepID=A0ABR3BQH0_9TREE